MILIYGLWHMLPHITYKVGLLCGMFFILSPNQNFTVMTNYEFKILRGSDTDVQKTLNQWKHEFKLKIHSFQVCPEGVCVMLIRVKKQ